MPRKVPPEDIVQTLYSELDATHISASGLVGTAKRLFLVHAMGGTTPGAVELRDGMDGPLKLRIEVQAGGHAVLPFTWPVYFANGIAVVIENGAKANIQHE